MHYIANKCRKERYGEWGALVHLSKAECGGPDSNRRTPTGMNPESIAFNLARQPPLAPRLNDTIRILGYSVFA